MFKHTSKTVRGVLWRGATFSKKPKGYSPISKQFVKRVETILANSGDIKNSTELIHMTFIDTLVHSNHKDISLVRNDRNRTLFRDIVSYLECTSIAYYQSGRYDEILTLYLRRYKVKIELGPRDEHKMKIFDVNGRVFVSDTRFMLLELEKIICFIRRLSQE